MGTDIHPIVQVRQPDGPWESVKIPANDDYGNLLDGRNYNLFAVLGDVRNGTRFAGILTSSGFTPISSDRGIPEDAGFAVDNDGYVRCFAHREDVELDDEDDEQPHWSCNECRWMGDHSYGYVTLAELLAYPWSEAKTYLTGVMPLSEQGPFQYGQSYLDWIKAPEARSQMPSQYSSDVAGPGVVVIDEGQVPFLLAQPDARYYVRFGREVTVAYAVGLRFTDVALPWLESLGKPDDVRILFGFDS